MKFIWETSDIVIPSLIAVRNPDSNISTDHIKIIGKKVYRDEHTENTYFVMSLAMGEVFNEYSIEELVEYLNKQNFEPLTLPQKIAYQLIDRQGLNLEFNPLEEAASKKLKK